MRYLIALYNQVGLLRCRYNEKLSLISFLSEEICKDQDLSCSPSFYNLCIIWWLKIVMFCWNLGGFSYSIIKTIQAWSQSLINFLIVWLKPWRAEKFISILYHHCFSKMQSMPNRKRSPAVRWVDRKSRLLSWQMGHVVLRGWAREKEKHWPERLVYFYWKEVFLSQKITLHLEMLYQILALSCIVENPVCFLFPCSIPSHTLAGQCRSGWDTIQGPLPAISLEPIQSGASRGSVYLCQKTTRL